MEKTSPSNPKRKIIKRFRARIRASTTIWLQSKVYHLNEGVYGPTFDDFMVFKVTSYPKVAERKTFCCILAFNWGCNLDSVTLASCLVILAVTLIVMETLIVVETLIVEP